MAFYLCFSELPRVLLEEDGTPSPLPAPPSSKTPSTASFRPSIAVIVGVLTTMFSLTFLLLLYAKHCRRHVSSGGYNGSGGPGFHLSANRLNSGVDRSVVESLPVFRFGSLRGPKEGLECAVCLNRFEPAEVLRLLPKCKHGFHVECVDVWLDAHSTCPLCRVRVDPEDVLLVLDPKSEPEPEIEPTARGSKGGDGAAVNYPIGRRISGRHSSAGEKCSDSLQIVVQPVDPVESRVRRSEGGDVTGAAIGCFDRGRKDGLLLTESAADKERFERRFSYRIIVSGSDGTLERWSDLKPSDLLFLRPEMIITDSGRFSASKAGGGGGAGGRSVINLRSVSEITAVSRFPEGEEERTTRKWLGFAAKRTARWLGNGPSS